MAYSPILVNIGQGLSMMVGLPAISHWDNETRPQKPKTGTIGFNNETNSLEYWDGSGWYAAAMV